MTQLEIREMSVRSVNTEERTITGIAVPYGQATSIDGYKERFEPGAFGDSSEVKLFYGHKEPIGRVTEGKDTDEGYEITARISETERGNEVYTLMRDGVLNRFSVGFIPVEHRMDGDTVIRTKADLKEVSVVAFPAYEGAKVSEVRESQTINNKEGRNMSDEIKYAPESEVADLRGSFEDLERRFAMIGESNSDNAPVFRDGGSLLKALAANSQEARDFATTANADIQPAWVTDDLRLQVENRNIVNLFSRSALPSSGLVVSYKKVSAVSGAVGVQGAEGDSLPYMEVTLDDASANVKTYGGYVSLSRQAIERSETSLLNVSLRYMANQYAKATNDAARAAFVGGTYTNTETLTSDTAANWIDLVVDSVDKIHNNSKGSEAQFILVSSDVYKRLAHMVGSDNRPLFSISGQSVNSLGSANLVAGTLSIAGLPVIKDPALAANSCYVAASDALTVWESSGAPFALTDQNIITLTSDFSLYGYMAVGITNELSVVKATVTVA